MQLHLIADKLYCLLTSLILLTITAINLHYQELAGWIIWLYIQISQYTIKAGYPYSVLHIWDEI